MRRRSFPELKIPQKANRILNGILVVLILIIIRLWHLAVVQHEEKLQEAKRPQERKVIENAPRATIRDRFNIPLALNKVQYMAYVTYGPIRDLPRSVWKKNEKGKKVKQPFRKEYITKLSQFLATELGLNAERIEDIIHSKAAILGNVPCLIKENITEDQYFKLKMIEKDWPGVYAQITAKRCYPLGPVAGEVIGYLGPISRSEYLALTQELKDLRYALQNWEEDENRAGMHKCLSLEEMEKRLQELEKKAYSLNDFVGKSGVEASYDEELRGQKGKHLYLSDTKGNFLKELEGSLSAKPGDAIVLSISSELQEYAERLLAEYDHSVSQRSAAQKLRNLLPENQPWIKGGAVVAMDPNTGEIFALASFPRFDPNDFILMNGVEEAEEKKERIHRWLEDDKHIANVWNLKTPLVREHFNPTKGVFEEEKKELSWEMYLSLILPKNSPVRQTISKKNTLADAMSVQKRIDQLVALFESKDFSIGASKVIDFLYGGEENIPLGVMITLQEREFLTARLHQVFSEVEALKEQLYPFFNHLTLNYEKLLLADLYRVALDLSKFSPRLADILGEMTLGEYHEISGRFTCVREALKKKVYSLFSEIDFKKWRETHFKDFLAQKRKEEKKALSKYARPFIEYLDQERKNLFDRFWQQYEWHFISVLFTGASPQREGKIEAYIKAIEETAQEIEEETYPEEFWVKEYKKVKHLLEDLDTSLTMAFLQTSRSFDELNRPLLGIYRSLKGSLEKDLASAFYPAYGFGFARSQAFRSATTIGSIFKLVPAYEALRQRFPTQGKSPSYADLNPLTIIDDKHLVKGKMGSWNVGFTLDGHAIPMFYHGGRLPRSEHPKIGKVDILKALEASSNPYFSILAGDILEDPEDLYSAASLLGYGEKTKIDLPGEYPGRLPGDITYNRTGLYAMAIGQHSLCGTPLQAAIMLSAFANGGKVLKPQIVSKRCAANEVIETKAEVRWEIFLPKEIQELLLTGLRQVVGGEKGTARNLKNQFSQEFLHKIIGKTSTAESIERISLDGTSGTLKLKHIWFGAIAYETEDFSKPELVVVVYLCLGEFGKDAAPLAAKIVQKWLDIKKSHSCV